jgi:hypothetical protein
MNLPKFPAADKRPGGQSLAFFQQLFFPRPRPQTSEFFQPARFNLAAPETGRNPAEHRRTGPINAAKEGRYRKFAGSSAGNICYR